MSTFIAKCAACEQYIGTAEQITDIDALAVAHDETCPATTEQKKDAAFDLRLRHFLAQEGHL